MDEIFHKTTNPFDCVKIAKELPHRYDKKGNPLIDYNDTEEARATERRRSSVTGAPIPTGRGGILGADHGHGSDSEKETREHKERP